MSMRSLLTPILDNDRLTHRLDDAESRMLVEWLVERVEKIARDRNAQAKVQRLSQRARAIGRFIVLWCHERSPSAALQLAATERFTWPLPKNEVDACDLLSDILAWEDTSDE